MSLPAYKLFEGTIPSVIKDVQENGQIGTASKRIIEAIAKQVIRENLFFNNQRQLRGSGARLNKLSYSTRKGWHKRNRNDNEDFKGLAEVKVLSENLKVDLYLETEFQWSIIDLKDTEAGYDALKSYFQSALLEELPVEFNKRVLDKLDLAIKEGVEWNNDQGVSETAIIPVTELDFSTEAKSRESLSLMTQKVIDKTYLDNPMLYKPTPNKFIWVLNPDTDKAINEIKGYQVATGDKNYDDILNNNPTKLLGNVKVIVTNELPKNVAAWLLPAPGAFNNISFIFTTLPKAISARTDFVGTSSELKFFKINTDAFAVNLSYWAVKFGLVHAFKNVLYPQEAFIAFKENDTNTGIATIETSITDTVNSAADYSIVVLDDNFNEVATFSPTLLDGTVELWSTISLESGSYQAFLLFKGNDINENQIKSTAMFMVNNKSYTQPQTGSVSNKETKVTFTKVEDNKEAAKAEAKAKAKAKAEAIKAAKNNK